MRGSFGRDSVRGFFERADGTRVWRLPYDMTEDLVKPEDVTPKPK